MLLALVLALVPEAAACAACACGDPTLTTAGLEKPFAGRVRLGTTFRYRWATLDEAPGRVELEDRYQLDVAAIGAVTDRVVFSAVLPLGVAGVRSPDLAWQRAVAPGDLALDGRFVIVRDPAQRHLGGLTAGLDLPTGPRVHGAEGPLPRQVGQGVFVGRIGVWYGAFLGAWSVFVAGQARVPTPPVPGWDDVRPGPGGLGTIAVQAAPHPAVALRASLDARGLGPDVRDGAALAASGGWLLTATPTVVASPTTDLVLYAGVRFPVAQHAASGEHEGVSPEVGLVADL